MLPLIAQRLVQSTTFAEEQRLATVAGHPWDSSVMLR